MRWLVIAAAVVTLLDPGRMRVHSQCFTDDDRFNAVLQTNLQFIGDFSFNLLNEFQSMNKGENLFFSPYSIWLALTLAYFGSAGETESQLKTALRMDDKIEALRLWKAIELTYMLRELVGANYVFKVVSKIYRDDDLAFRECVVNILKNENEVIDFENTLNATKTINSFVEETTEGMIKDLLDPSALEGAFLVLVNAAYFKGMWVEQFQPSLTADALFTSDNAEQKIPMMNLFGKFQYGVSEELGVRLLELPYEGNAISMYILLPIAVGDAALNDVIKGLSGSLFQGAKGNMTDTFINVRLPKFTMKTRLEDELTDGLRNLGITDLFNKTASNLTKFVEGRHLSVDNGVHEAHLKVGEEGTEAAAATALIIGIRVRIVKPKNTVNFFCDRPFLFLLYDNDINNILFIGVFWKPAGSGLDSKGQGVTKKAVNGVRANLRDQPTRTGATDPSTTPTEYEEYQSTHSTDTWDLN